MLVAFSFLRDILRDERSGFWLWVGHWIYIQSGIKRLGRPLGGVYVVVALFLTVFVPESDLFRDSLQPLNSIKDDLSTCFSGPELWRKFRCQLAARVIAVWLALNCIKRRFSRSDCLCDPFEIEHISLRHFSPPSTFVRI
jgi:hypothetical protein